MTTNCPHCGSDRIHRGGTSNGRPRGVCRSCNKTFYTQGKLPLRKRGRKAVTNEITPSPAIPQSKIVKPVDPRKVEYECKLLLSEWDLKQEKWSRSDRRPVASAQEAYRKEVA